MEGKLIFSFCQDLNFAFDYAQLAAAGGRIKFGEGLEEIDMIIVSDIVCEPIDDDIVKGIRPVLEFAWSQEEVVSPDSKEKEPEAPLPALPERLSVFSRVQPPEQIQIQKQDAEIPTFPYSSFEAGSSSALGPLTKT